MAQELVGTREADLPREEVESAEAAQVQQLDISRAFRLGGFGGLAAVFISAIGMIEAFSGRTIMQPSLTLSYAAMALVPLVFGYLAGKMPPPMEGVQQAEPGPRNVLAGLIAGSVSGLITSAFILLASVVNLRDVFIAISPVLLRIMTFDQPLATGLLLPLVGGAAAGSFSGGLHLVPERWREPLISAFMWTLLIGLLEDLIQQVLRGLSLEAVNSFMFSGRGGLELFGGAIVFAGIFAFRWISHAADYSVSERYAEMPEDRRRYILMSGIIVGVIALAIIPQIVGVFISEVFDLIGIFLLMGLGLNIVIGFAGLLDLGYVAFFAVGAYTTAILTSPQSPAFTPEITFWMALPFVILAAALAGIVVGTPVLRMRGDYLAIVTLGFGEIARILFISEAMFPYVGGAQGIISVPKVAVGGWEAQTPPEFFYLIAGFVIIAIYITWALENSRIGRAWKAMREDEPVAEVMGIDTVQAKLTAFIMGAIIASFGGALFASKIGSVFPHSFQILVSIQVLVLIIVGGMGSIPGVVVGAIIIIGLPELLREFAEFKFLMYGALLIYMMLNKPEGFVPTRERVRELHEEEMLQDAWLADERARVEKGSAASEGRDRGATEGLV